jgi:hypothetical protein
MVRPHGKVKRLLLAANGRVGYLLAVQCAVTASLVACGGGGGGAGGSTETPQSVPETDPKQQQSAAGTYVIDPLPTGTKAFRFSVTDQMQNLQNIGDSEYGPVAIGWNLRDAKRTMNPGMKILFWGDAQACNGGGLNGPVSAGPDDDFQQALLKTKVSGNAVTPQTRWTPSGNSDQCSADVQSKTGPTWIFINPVFGGHVGMYTHVGPKSSGEAPFLQATGSAGIDGEGYNANGQANFVAFRQAWGAKTAIQPWKNENGEVAEARVVMRQTLGSTEVGEYDGATVQVKQQAMISVINTECQKSLKGKAGPCSIQYLFNTASVRAGVTDWEAKSPSQQGRVWFDKAQASIPIVAGMVPTVGKEVLDKNYSLALYRSEGNASLHSAKGDVDFDIRIRFSELLNGARIIAAEGLSTQPSEITDQNMVDRWGSQWNDPSKWTLVATMFGQEIYNDAFLARPSWIGGGFSTIYVGPAN